VKPRRKNIIIGPEVHQALASHKAIVALESTVIAHGLPYPHNLETALECEKTVRANRGIPATVGIVRGALKIGLTEGELQHLARARRVSKTGPSNLAAVMLRQEWGATSVSTTLLAANKVGIKVLVTGGIGGVHLNAGRSFDISADLAALSRFQAIVVCSGVKAPLDVGATIQYLETHGIPVIGYRTAYLPNFYTRSSPYQVDLKAGSVAEIARFARNHWNLQSGGCILVTVPVPRHSEVLQRVIDRAIGKAHAALRRTKVSGREVTPFLLARINDETHGASLHANIALLRNNALIGTRIAKALHA
jgi:pseudouridine-5'-phosphate glycosidase